MDKYRFAFDIGTTSIGWAVLTLDHNNNVINIIDCGSRIFSNSRQDKEYVSLAVKRRKSRHIRKRYDRLFRRRQLLLSILTTHNLFPSNPKERELLKDENPYFLREKLLKEKFPLHKLGRAIMHLNKRRGFKSSRKGDKTDGGEYKEAISHLKQLLGKDKTLGEFFSERLRKKQNIICRKSSSTIPNSETNHKKISSYDFYISRDLVEKELEIIWSSQQIYYPEILTESLLEKIKNVIFFQRPLLPQEVGKCQFEEGESRCPINIPTFELYRLYLDFANLSIWDVSNKTRTITPEERDVLIEKCKIKQNISFSSIRKILKLDATNKFIHAELKEGKEEKDCKIKGCPSITKLHDTLKNTFNVLSVQQLDTLIFLLTDCEQDDILHNILTKQIEFTSISIKELRQESLYKEIVDSFSMFNEKNTEKLPITIEDIQSLPLFTEEEAHNLIKLDLETTKYSKLSLKALKKILPYLQIDLSSNLNNQNRHIPTYSDACAMAGYNHSNQDSFVQTRKSVDENGECVSSRVYSHSLPYYGSILTKNVMGEWKKEKKGHIYSHLNNRQRFGFISNPSAHVAMNQLRMVTNALIKKYGNPDSINIELARDLPMGAKSKRELQDTIEKNTAEKKRLIQDIKETVNIPYPSEQDIIKYNLFKEAERAWKYVQCIYCGKPISISELFSRDNLIEIDHILNESNSNDDTFNNKILAHRACNVRKGGKNPDQCYDNKTLMEISERAKNLPKNKAWRFLEGATEKYKEQREYAAKTIGDTRYIARLAKKYLTYICPPEQIMAVTGTHTNTLANYLDVFSLFNDYLPQSSDMTYSELKKISYRTDLNNDVPLKKEFSEDIQSEILKDINNTLKKKNRNNHFHHAIDACIIGFCNVSTMQRIANQEKEISDIITKLKRQNKSIWYKLNKEEKIEFCRAMRLHQKDITQDPLSKLYPLPSEIKIGIEIYINQVMKKHPTIFTINKELFQKSIHNILNNKIISHKVDHNTGGELHEGTVFGKEKHSLRFKDFELKDLRLIENKKLLVYIIGELLLAHGIPSNTKEINSIVENIHNGTISKTNKTLHNALHYHKNSTQKEIRKLFLPKFTTICKSEEAQILLREAWLSIGEPLMVSKNVLRRIPCLYQKDKFLGNVHNKIAVEEIRIQDLPCIKDTFLLARLLHKLRGISIQEAYREAQYLHSLEKDKDKKKYVHGIFSGVPDKIFQEQFQHICTKLNIRSILCVANKDSLIWLKDKTGNEVKGVNGGNNAYMSIYIDSKGKWQGECVSAFNANQKDFICKWQSNPDHIHVIDLFQSDAVELDMKINKVTKRGIFIVCKMNQANGLFLFYNKEANVAPKERVDELKKIKHYKQVALSSFQELNPKFVYIDPLGKIIYKKNIRYTR